MKSALFHVCRLSVTCLVIVTGCAKRTPTIQGLLAHFQQTGLIVQEPPPLSPEEQQLMDDMKKLQDLWIIRPRPSADPLAEKTKKVIDGVTVYIERFKDPADARNTYERRVDAQRKDEALVEKYGQQISAKCTYLLKDAFFIWIPHFTISVKNGRMQPPAPIEINDQATQRIRTVFENFGGAQ